MKKALIILVIIIVAFATYIIYDQFKKDDDREKEDDIKNRPVDITASLPPGRQPDSLNFKFEEFYTRTPQGKRVPPPQQLWPNIQTLMDILEVIRASLGHRPITITSAYRSTWHNSQAGGVSNSRHLQAKAVDFKVSGVSPSVVQNKIRELKAQNIIPSGGLGLGTTFTHLDFGRENTEWTY